MTQPEDHLDILLDTQAIANRVKEMGEQITHDYRDKHLTALVVLKGSFVFAADLIRCIDLPLHVEFIGVRSYGSRVSTSGVVQITMDVKHPLNGQDVVIVEDIVDTGLTISYLRDNLLTRQPASLKLAALLHKPERTTAPVEIAEPICGRLWPGRKRILPQPAVHRRGEGDRRVGHGKYLLDGVMKWTKQTKSKFAKSWRRPFSRTPR
jgi:hypoxanthine phosphoribosyltransferase